MRQSAPTSPALEKGEEGAESMMKQSLLGVLGLPGEFGVALLLIALVLVLAPYLSGHDLGVIKIPEFGPGAKRALKIGGPSAMVAVLAFHLPFIETADRDGNGMIADTACTISGVVFDTESNRRLGGLWIDLYRDLSSIQQRPKMLDAGVARTGPDGSFAINCSAVENDQFPILLAVRHKDWDATRITGPNIGERGRWEGINIAIPMREIKLRPLRDVGVSFSSEKISADWFLVGAVENKSNHTYPCLRASFQMSTPYQERIQGEPVRNLGLIDVEVRDVEPGESRSYREKLPRQVGIGLHSKQEC